MHYTLHPKGVCSFLIELDIEDNKIHNLVYTGGCNGNLKAISKLVEGMEAARVVELLRGNTCGFKPTSCGDQLAVALEEALAQA